MVSAFRSLYEVDPETESRTVVLEEEQIPLQGIAHIESFAETVLLLNESGQLMQYEPDAGDSVLLHR